MDIQDEVIGALLVLAGGFANWCFNSAKDKAE